MSTHSATHAADKRFSRIDGVAIAVIGIHLLLVAYIAAKHFPVIDEIGHLPSGVIHWREGNFGPYFVNPPLVRLIAALPFVASGEALDTSAFQDQPAYRGEYGVGRLFLYKHGMDAVKYFVWGRWACLLFALIGATFVYRFAKRLWGPIGALIALVAYCASPSILANSAWITPDAGAAACGIAATYYFWRWMKTPALVNALVAGIWLGLALLTKSTWVIALGVFPLIAIVDHFVLGGKTFQDDQHEMRSTHFFAQLAFTLLVGLFTLNAGYGFERFGEPLGGFEFRSEMLTGTSIASRGGDQTKPPLPGNAFSQTTLASLPVPLPANYVLGIDYVRMELERGYPSFLNGVWKHGGWLHYYLYAILVKTPLGFLVLLALASLTVAYRTATRRLGRQCVRKSIVVLLPAVAVIGVASSQTGFNHHLRYVLPAYPFAFVWLGSLGWLFDKKETPIGSRQLVGHAVKRGVSVGRPAIQLAIVVAAAWGVTDSLRVYPHSQSYFNAVAGGPENGWKHLHNSNVDWGQDISYLAEWLEAHPDIGPVGVAPFHFVDVRSLGLDAYEPNRWPLPGSELPETSIGPMPGWFVISVCHLAGEPADSYWGRPSDAYKLDPSRQYFRYFEPAGRLGYSMNIYHISRAECNAVRVGLGLPPLPRPSANENIAENQSSSQFGTANRANPRG